jgi:hypothetical protein
MQQTTGMGNPYPVYHTVEGGVPAPNSATETILQSNTAPDRGQRGTLNINNPDGRSSTHEVTTIVTEADSSNPLDENNRLIPHNPLVTLLFFYGRILSYV